MTNAERIQAHNELLADCIETAENLPDAGSGVVETCTLKIIGAYVEGSFSDVPVQIHQVIYPTLSDDGSVIWEAIDDGGIFLETLVEIENVVVGQTVVVGYNADLSPGISTENAEFLLDDYASLGCCVVRCTKANDTAVVTIVNKGG